MSKENDDWFEGIDSCRLCGSENLKREIREKHEVLVCADCGIPNANQPVV